MTHAGRITRRRALGLAAAAPAAFYASRLFRAPPALATGGPVTVVPVSIQNNAIKVIVDQGTGGISDIVNLHNNTSLAYGTYVFDWNPLSPWQVQRSPNDFESDWYPRPGIRPTTTVTQTTSRRLDITWTDAAEGYTVGAVIETPDGADHATFAISVDDGGSQVSLIEYPVIRGVRKLHATADDHLAHPLATGFLFKNPASTFQTPNSSSPTEQELAEAGIVQGIYTDGFNGPAMQWMAYYIDGGDGFYLAADDPDSNVKWLDFFKFQDAGGGNPDTLEIRFRHASPDIHAANGYTSTYKVIVGALTEGTWYEAADRYRVWAIDQPWAYKGRLVDRAGDRSDWLVEGTGYATFGINAATDKSQAVNDLQTAIGIPAFHVLSANWQRFGADYIGHFNYGRDGYYPDTLSDATMAAIDAGADHVTGFSFPWLLDGDSGAHDTNPDGSDGADRADADSAYQVLPAYTISPDEYRFDWLCPVPALARQIENYRMRESVKADVGFDAAYYDIAASNSLKICTSPNHGHKVGGGVELMSAHRRILAEAKAFSTEAKGEYVPQGSETIIENLVGELDYYQARAEASPMAGFEGHRYRSWIKSGLCEKIPAFAYVYHDYGPVRLDGWGSLANDNQQGDLFYWVAARVGLWGGIFELDWEFTSMFTDSAGVGDDPSVSSNPTMLERPHQIDSAKTQFVARLGTARTGFAKDFLAYGQMLRPVPVSPAPANINLSYYFVNYFTTAVLPEFNGYQESGTFSVPSVIGSAYRFAPAGSTTPTKAGFLYVNLDPVTSKTVSLTFDPAAYGLGSVSAYVITASGTTPKGPVTAGVPVTNIQLPPRDVVLVELH